MFVGSLLLINQQGNLKVEPALIQFQNLQDQVQLRVVDNLGVDFTSKATFKSSDTKTIFSKCHWRGKTFTIRQHIYHCNFWKLDRNIHGEFTNR